LLATGFKRCRNILKGDVLPVAGLSACLQRWIEGGHGAKQEDFAGLVEKEEKDLLEMVAAQAEKLQKAEGNKDFPLVFEILSQFGPAIDLFFDQVRVNAEEKDLRCLRHGFLREIHGLFSSYADFSEVAPAEK